MGLLYQDQATAEQLVRVERALIWHE